MDCKGSGYDYESARMVQSVLLGGSIPARDAVAIVDCFVPWKDVVWLEDELGVNE